MYEVVYLPTAMRELEEAIDYIATELAAPDAAQNFIDRLDAAAQSLRTMPYRHPIYPSAYARRREVRFFPIKNHIIFYVVHETQARVEIWRVQYARKNTAV